MGWFAEKLKRERAAEKAAIDKLRVRARKIGMTIRANAGDWELNPPTRLQLEGLRSYIASDPEKLETQLAKIEDALGELRTRPTDQQLRDAWALLEERRRAEAQARHEAAIAAYAAITCDYCGQHPDDTGGCRVGPEDADLWVHRRCLQAWKEQLRTPKPAAD